MNDGGFCAFFSVIADIFRKKVHKFPHKKVRNLLINLPFFLQVPSKSSRKLFDINNLIGVNFNL